MKIYYWHNPSNQRFYMAIRTKDLFNDNIIVQIAGGARHKGKKILTTPLDSRAAVAAHIKKLNIVRKKRGYRRSKIVDIAY